MEQAYMLLNSPEAKAFDLSLEPKAVYDIYNTGHFRLVAYWHAASRNKAPVLSVLPQSMSHSRVLIRMKTVIPGW